MLRVRETAGGGTVIETWMLDTAPDPLADIARELAYLDAQGGRPQHEAGTRLDRNVRLFVRSVARRWGADAGRRASPGRRGRS